MSRALTIRQALAYWTEVAFASYEYAASLKKTSKYELNRLKSIADKMVEDCKRFGVTVDDCRVDHCSRVIEVMFPGERAYR